MTSKIRESLSWEKVAIVFLFLVGILLRLRQYLTGRSLWADEAMLALNIVNRGVGELFRLLEYDQGAPIGFLMVEKAANLLFGRNEYALRLFPFLAGIFSIWLFHLLLKRITSTAGHLSALALFVFNPRLVYYSSEVKQYILDVVVCVGLLLVASPLLEARGRKRDFGWLSAAGFLALWFSHPAVFVLAGIGLTLLIVYLHRREYAQARYILGMGMFWLSTIAFLYFLILNDIQQNAYMQEYWQGAFLPFPPWSEPDWFHRSLTENIGVQFGIPYAVYLVFGLLLAGWIALWKTRQTYAAAFGLILLFALIASSVRLYPVFERMILFLVPVGIILIGKTIDVLHQKLESRPLMGVLATLALAGYLIYGPLVTSLQSFIEPKYFEHIRPTMEHLRDSWKDGDALYISNGALPAFRFYAPMYGLESIPYEYGEREDYKNPQHIVTQLESFKGHPRVWILFSHVYEKGEFNEKDFILDYLNQTGKKKREFRVPGTSVFLYVYNLEN